MVTSVKKRMWQKLKSLLWSSVVIITSTSLSSADIYIFTSSSDLNSRFNRNALPGQALPTYTMCDKVYTFRFAVNKHMLLKKRLVHLQIKKNAQNWMFCWIITIILEKSKESFATPWPCHGSKRHATSIFFPPHTLYF